jgi:acyl-CoA synthetase (NDP forming)
MLDTARVLATQPMIGGRRVAVVTNSPSPGVLARATLEAVGLEPVDPPRRLGWHSTADDYHAAVRAAQHDPGVDAVLVIHAPPRVDAIGEASTQIDAACAGATKPVVAVMLGSGDGPLLPGSSVPSFSFPEQAAAVLGRIAAYAHWRRTEGADDIDPEQAPDHIDVAGADALITEALAAGEPSATPETIRELLLRYGVTMPETRTVTGGTPGEVAAIATDVGFPVAVKARHRRVGRTAEAGVALDLTNADDVARALTTMREHLGDDAATVIVQRMTSPGVDIRIRVRADERLGPVITVGLGGVQADAIGDESSRLAPVSPSTAMSMIADTRAAAALTADSHERLADVVTRIALLASDHPAIAELDLNPVVVNADGCCVVDALITLRASDRPEPAVRRLE